MGFDLKVQGLGLRVKVGGRTVGIALLRFLKPTMSL